MYQRDEPRAGLPLSVGNAALPLRILLSCVFGATGAIATFADAVAMRQSIAVAVIAVMLVGPFSVAALTAAVYVLAPWSRFGLWLDRFLPRLQRARIAIVTLLLVWLIAALLTLPYNAHP